METSEGFEQVERYGSEREARNAVEQLTIAGLGATWRAEGATGAQTEFVVTVVSGDGPRAREVLGLPSVVDDDVEEGPLRRFPDWVYVLVIFLVAMVVLPTVAFFVSYKLSGG